MLNKERIEKEIRNIKAENFDKYFMFSCEDTVYTHLKISNELKKCLNIDINNEGYLAAEYWVDKDSFHYIWNDCDEDGEVIDSKGLDDLVKSEYLNNLFLRLIEEKREVKNI